MSAPPLLLASTSPRRVELLRATGRAVATVDPGLDDATEEALAAEALRRGRGPEGAVVRLAVAKLLAALPRAAPGQAVLAADTTVVLDGALLNKARDRAEAARMLAGLRGRAHEALTGLAGRDRRGRLRTAVGRSRVVFAAFDEAALAAYLASERWRGKAGAYGLQDPEAAPLIAGVEGSRTNVIGLPLELVPDLVDAP